MPTRARAACPTCRRAGACGCPVPGTAARNHHGRSAAERGYGQAYRKARAALLADRPRCAMRLTGCTGMATTAQHTGRGATGALVPACAHCNYADGARRANRLRARR